MTPLAESLLKCRVEGNVLHLPPMSDGPLSNYADVRKALLNAGATYKRNTFVFKSDAQPLIDRLTGGESVNIKKEFQFFPTPEDLADRMAALAELEEEQKILEPSAGQGALVWAIGRYAGLTPVYCYELMLENQQELKKIPTVRLLGDDFLQNNSNGEYDRIIANPPFSKNQDIDHILEMYRLLKVGGVLVTICSKHFEMSGNKKETEFKGFLSQAGAETIEVERGQFKESGTMVPSCIIIIQKT